MLIVTTLNDILTKREHTEYCYCHLAVVIMPHAKELMNLGSYFILLAKANDEVNIVFNIWRFIFFSLKHLIWQLNGQFLACFTMFLVLSSCIVVDISIFPRSTLGTKRLASAKFVNGWDNKRQNVGNFNSHFLVNINIKGTLSILSFVELAI